MPQMGMHNVISSRNDGQLYESRRGSEEVDDDEETSNFRGRIQAKVSSAVGVEQLSPDADRQAGCAIIEGWFACLTHAKMRDQ